MFGNKVDVATALCEDDLRFELGLSGTTTGKEKGRKIEGMRPLELFMGSITYRSGYAEGTEQLPAF